MMDNIGRNVCEKLFHMQLQRADTPAAPPPGAAPPSKPPSRRRPRPRVRKTIESGGGAEPQARAANGAGNGAEAQAKPVRRNEPKVGRNNPCPCGSGKKYKKCHGDVATT